MKYKSYFAGFMAALLLPVFTGCGNGSGAVKAQTAATESSQSSNSIVVWGEVKYNNEYQINIDFPATVQDVLVKEGDKVGNGSALITLSMDDYRENLKKLQAQADAGRAAVNNVDQAALETDIQTIQKQLTTKTAELKNGSKPELQLLQNALTRAEKEVKDAQDDENKNRKLYQDGVISKADLDKFSDVLNQKLKVKADAEDNIAKTKRTLQEELDSLNTALQYKQVQLNQQKDTAAAAQADLNIMSGKAKKPYLSGNTVISNLNNGIVKEISVVRGSAVGTQYVAQKVVDLIDADSIYVSAEVPEEFIQQISPESKAIIVPTANKKLKITGHIVAIANNAVEKDGDRIVKVQVKPDDKDNMLRPGLTADVQFSRISGK